MMTELPSIAKAAELIRQGELTPLELVEHCLGRIQQFDKEIHAWTLVDADGARREARRLGGLLDGQKPLSPLHGIPIGVKDMIDVAGLPTLCGAKWRTPVAAESDAPVVANLRAAGAIILGKTVTTEFACFDPAPTRNPWNPAHTPGGSSSGSAAAVALEMCLAAVGTQTGGSIIRPAAYCGVAGFKPAFGGAEMRGVFPVSYHLDHVGPLARGVGDLYLVWQQMANRMSENTLEYLQDKLLGTELNSWIDQAAQAGALAVAKGPLLDRASPETMAHVEQCVAKLKTALQIVPWRLPDSLAHVHQQHRLIMAVEAAATHRPWYEGRKADYGPRISELIEEGLQTRAVDYAEALQHQRLVRREMMQLLQSQAGDWMHCFVLPTTPQPAPDNLLTTGDPYFNSPWSYLGLPAITIPTGLSAGGLPLGLQFVSPLAPQAFAMAALAERLIRFQQRPPMLEEIS